MGSLDEVLAAAPQARRIDLDGRTVLPAFIDSHTHFHRAAVLKHLHLDFETLLVPDVASVLAHVAERAAGTAAGGWIEGDSISAARLAEGRLPDRAELDSVSAGHPVIIRGIGKHVIAANSAALALAGIDRDTPDPPGGRIERDEQGEPTGILHERAKLRLDASANDTVVPRASREQRLEALRTGMSMMHRLGVAAIHEMVRQPEEAGDLAALHAAGELSLRTSLYYRIHESPMSLDWLTSLGLRSGWGDAWLRVAGVKISVDGWCIFRNAAVYQDYDADPGNAGLLRIEPEDLDALVSTAAAAGLSVAVHAVGARAVDAALDAFGGAPPAPLGRHRVEHAHLDVDEGQLRRLRDLGLTLSAQPGFLPAYAPDWRAGLAPERVDGIMPLASAQHMGIPVIINSDMPSGPVGPLHTIAAAVERAADVGTIGAGEGLSMVEAWRAHTSLPADVTGDRVGGRLEPGRAADLVVLQDDPFRAGAGVPEGVGATMVGGIVRHDPEGWLA